MPNGDFWFLAGLGCAFAGWGVMRLLCAYADRLSPPQRDMETE